MLGPLGIHLDEVEVLDPVFLDELGQREAVHLAESEIGDRREPARAQCEWGGLRLRAGRTRTGVALPERGSLRTFQLLGWVPCPTVAMLSPPPPPIG